MNPTLLGYPIQIADQQTVRMPGDAEALSVSFCNGNHMLYVVGSPNAPLVEVVVAMCTMGESLPGPGLKFVGVLQYADRDHHVFYRPTNPQPTLYK